MLRRLPPWVPYVVPFVVYLALTAVEAHYKGHYPLFYSAKIVIAAIVAIVLRSPSTERRSLPWAWMAVAVVIGVVLNFAWFAIDRFTPHPHWLTQIMGTRAAFNPNTQIADPTWRVAFLAIRFSGLVLLIPYLEERFYRDFLLRYIVDQDDFRRVPVGTTQLIPVVFSTILFASTHPEWLSAIVFGLAMCALVRFSKDVRVCMAAHAATNLALGVTVLMTGNWQYW